MSTQMLLPEELPETIGKYAVLGVAGQGNMGIVYEAHDPFSDSRVAIKVCQLDASGAASRIVRKLFFNEAHTAGALDHPNILAIRDAGEHEGQPYIVMEYIAGAETLHKYTQRDNLLPVQRAVEIAYCCAKALDYAHRRGVVHRDVKATNIMLTGDGRVKICDFGIARYAKSELTEVMGMMGSPRYMSPEQAREEEITSQSDLFSLGVVLYELLTGRPPFVARGFTELMRKIINDDPPPLGERRPDVTPGLEAVMTRALAKDLETRYTTGQAMASDLASVFGDLAHSAQGKDAERRYDQVRELRFFRDFSDDEVREVLAASTWERCNSGDRIISEGTLGHAFYVIANGDVAVCKDDKQISTLGTGDCFGEMGYLSGTQRSASIVALDEVTLLKISSTLMERASTSCQLRFTQAFVHTLVERLARTSEALARAGD